LKLIVMISRNIYVLKLRLKLIVMISRNIYMRRLRLKLIVMISQNIHVRLRLKLIVMISLNIHMMTSLDHMCVQCVTNGLLGKQISLITETNTLEKMCILVLSVRNGFYLRVVCVAIRIFTQVDTSAQNVEKFVQKVII